MKTDCLPATSFAELRKQITGLPQYDKAVARAAQERQDSLTKPPGSLGRMEELAVFMAGWQGREIPTLRKAQALVFAGNHGICAQGVNVYPQSVTAQMVANFEAGGAAINQLCQAAGARLSVIALDLERPTHDPTTRDAMSEAETLDAMTRGYAAVDPAADIIVLGEMGIGNSTIAAALALALFGGEAADWVGPGTGAGAAGVSHKADVIARVQARIANSPSIDPLQILAATGGREQAALCGAILAARMQRIPVILDGFICTASAAVLHVISSGLLGHCIAGHVGAEPGHRPLLARLEKRPLLDLGMRLGEGSGAALALILVKAAIATHAGMATFDQAGVSGK
ncbi:MAG: nicotinate-nucleotide--dimethylbenzimidazole phosphoribosyltransferase [Hyphomicrobiaceae bacterium]